MGIRDHAYDPLMRAVDRLYLERWRRWAATGAAGSTIEIGIGTGLNLRHYPPGPAVYGVDPEPAMLGRAARRSRRMRGSKIRLAGAAAEELPFRESTFDFAVATLVFCTVANPRHVLLELKRVLKPGAPVRLLEHVRAGHPVAGKLLDVMTPAWSCVAGGCRLNRDTLGEVGSAGFEVCRVQSLLGGLLLAIEARAPLS